MARHVDSTERGALEVLLPDVPVDLQTNLSEARERFVESITLDKTCLRRRGGKRVGTEIIPGISRSILLPCHRIQNWGHMQRKLHVCSGSKQVHMRTTEHLTDGTECLGKTRPLSGKDLL